MDFVVKKGEVVFAKNDEAFQVVETVSFQNESYVLLMTVPTNFDEVLKVKEQETFFVREVINEKNEYFMEPINDKALIDELFKLIKNNKKSKKTK